MKKIFTSALLLCSGVIGFAQLLNVQSIEKVVLPEGITVNAATISPKGDFVVISQNETSGIHRFDLTSKAVTTISETGIPHELKISNDGSVVVFKEPRINANRLRQVALKAFDLNRSIESTIVPFCRDLQGVAIIDNNVVAVNSEKLTTKNLKGGEANVTMPVASIKYGQLCIDGKVISPQGTTGNSYLWPSVSPDGTRVLYFLATYGCYVANIDGSNPVRLGSLHAPRWFNNNTIVGMYDRDNGHEIYASRLVAVSVDGKVKQNLTEDASLALFPSISADGSKISYITPAGELFIINITR